jgi:hypothetical protein
MRTWLLTMSLVLACGVMISCMSPGLRAQEEGRKSGRRNYSAMATGAVVRSSAGGTYAVMVGARAVVGARRDEDSARVLSKAGVDAREVLERKERFVIYREAAVPPQGAGGAVLRISGGTHPVLLNKETGNLAVVTGNLRVKLAGAEASVLASSHGLTLAQEFPHLGTAFYTAPEGADLLSVLSALRADPRVAQADLELFEHIRVPH